MSDSGRIQCTHRESQLRLVGDGILGRNPAAQVLRSVYPFRYEPVTALESISPRQFQTYLLLVETALPAEEIGRKLGISTEAMKARTFRLFDMLGVSTRLELMMQYHYRERHGIAATYRESIG